MTKQTEKTLEDVANLFDDPSSAIKILQRAYQNEELLRGNEETYLGPDKLYRVLAERQRVGSQKAKYSTQALRGLIFPFGPSTGSSVDLRSGPQSDGIITSGHNLDWYDKNMK